MSAPTDVDALRAKIATFPFWYHHIELPGGVITPGTNPLNAGRYGIPADLTGKRVLDVGAWDGYWTFEALKRGARQVVAIDDFTDYLSHLAPSDRKEWQTFDLCREALGYTEEQCQRRQMNLYDIKEETLGRFDVVFFFGTIYHLRHPLLALDLLSAICDQEMYVESFICDGYSPYRGGLSGGYTGGQMIMEFYPENQLATNATNWWGPTLACLAHMVRSTGFSKVAAWNLMDNPGHAGHSRGFVQGIKPAAALEAGDPPRASK